MTEQMKQALKQEAENCKGDYTKNNYSVDVGAVPFLIIEGVNWYLDNLWYDADNEQPIINSSVVVMSKDKKELEVKHKVFGVLKGYYWCYLKDILPTIMEE